MAPDDEQVLVARLSAGDTGAFDEVYDQYRPRVFAFLLRMTRNRALAEDLLDERWLRLVRHAARLLPDTRLGPWLFTVARNLYWRRSDGSSSRRSAAGGVSRTLVEIVRVTAVIYGRGTP